MTSTKPSPLFVPRLLILLQKPVAVQVVDLFQAAVGVNEVAAAVDRGHLAYQRGRNAAFEEAAHHGRTVTARDE